MLRVAWAPNFCHPLPESHRFPMEKYTLIPEQLLYEGTITRDNMFRPNLLPEWAILLTHTNEYWNKLKYGTISPREARKMGFPFSPRLVTRGRTIAQGTLDNVAFAREYGAAINVAGGTHHAYADHGEGFCLLNDFAIAANSILHHEKKTKILIVDLDVHQGNGTASIFQKEERVFTFSMHCEANYPLKKATSDLDISLPMGTGDDQYLDILRGHLGNIIHSFAPDIIFYLAGVDILATDSLGKLNCSMQGCKERDELMIRTCYETGVPLVVSLGGGYSPQIRDIVEAHCNTFRLLQKIWF